jgi:hypothetical protein
LGVVKIDYKVTSFSSKSEKERQKRAFLPFFVAMFSMAGYVATPKG